MAGHASGHSFDADYWEQHWHERTAGPSAPPANPYLARELTGLVPGTALDAGCGAGAEAIWLAVAGWQVTAADISAEALTLATARAGAAGVDGRVEWVRADLGTWSPEHPFDLVTTHYAHPEMPQLDFYERLAGWVAPGGTLLVVGHQHTHQHDDTDHPPEKATATADAVTARLDPARWRVVTASEPRRTVTVPGGRENTLDDVVVRATRRR